MVLVRDSDGQKMSKSKGNILDPIDLIDGIELEDLVTKRKSGLMQPEMAEQIEKQTRKHFPDGIPSYGTDSLRFTFASLASTGRDIRFDLGRIGGYRNFCNKLWNAARYVLMNTEGKDTGLSSEFCTCSLPDRWIRSRLQRVTDDVTNAIEHYRLDLASQAIYEFVWNEYCDWYLELSKIVLQDADEASARGTRQTLVSVLESILRLAHPLIPFITEEIWQRIAPMAGQSGETIMLQPFPERLEDLLDEAATDELEWLMDFILGIRRIRGEMDISPGKPVAILLQNGSGLDHKRLENNIQILNKLGKIESLRWLTAEEKAPESAISLVGELKILIPMAGLIDKVAEIARLDKEIQKVKKDLPRVEAKLNNPKFVEKAPPEVVAKEQKRLEERRSTLAKLEEQAAKIQSL